MGTNYPAVRIVVTGSRKWTDYLGIFQRLNYQLAEHQQFLLAVGDCPSGADRHATVWGNRHLIWPVTVFHAPWEQRNRAAGPIRNHFMIDMFRPRLVLAFLRPDSRGTVDCANYAESKGIEVHKFRERGDGGVVSLGDPQSLDAGVRPDDAAQAQEARHDGG